MTLPISREPASDVECGAHRRQRHVVCGWPYAQNCSGGKTECQANAGRYILVAMDIRSQLLAAVRKSRLSERRLSMAATGSSDTLRNVRRGAQPRVDTVEALCRVLGLEVQLGPGLLPPAEDDAVPVRPPTEFTAALELPVYEWVDRSEEGYLRRHNDKDRAPAPWTWPTSWRSTWRFRMRRWRGRT